MTLHIATWFHADTADFSSTYAQALGDSTSASHYGLYERCIRVCFASARRWNPDARLVLVTNLDAASVFTPTTLRLLERLDVQRVVVENTHRTPEGYYGRWQNQFYVLDVIGALLERMEDAGDACLVLDSDCVVTGRLDDDLLGPEGLAGLPMPFEPDEVENGLTRRELGALVEEFPGSVPQAGIPLYFGGELVAATPPVLRQISERAEEGFRWSMQRFAEGRTRFTEEAHLLSFAIQSLGLPWRHAEFLRRLWTQPWKFRTARAGDEHRTIWHLPAEKKTGIVRLDRAVLRPESWFWKLPHLLWVRRAGAIVGVPKYTPLKLAHDMSGIATARIRRRLQASR